ncbi:ABC transporter permease [Bifidobacterium subtile]|jgi:putative ABC transport system permease protein|uniref:ABC transporter permease n=1 Tax=Bifidobacterium subtile TaxID=77635 RepID=A0A087E5J7_9BIFI|nr:ABC transporter permease [Bifidobacterium subtile]KFJ03048.1 ABC transporter permease [Bifidobacterium subtile]MCI1222464.1 ABC transporter permease [Bifidobacterium subtile]MCI1240958.1 ABC transporter permease [Bifidobacterium subtile]MCI1257946.1 ABC transporter permease [Bifidobacterium subtile]QOL37397.1 ABC transporter permease [Bifidobacterium subtile]
MFVITNAWKNVIRNKGRNLLVLVIVALIAAAATIGLSIRQSAQNARTTGLADTTVTAQISLDRNTLLAAAQKQGANGGQPDFQALRKSLAGKQLSLADYQKYAKASSAVKATYYSQSAGLSATTGFQPVSSSDTSAGTDSSASGQSDSQGSSGSSQDSQGYGAREAMGGRGMQSGDFKLTGFSSDTAVDHATNGKFTMSSGKVFGYDKVSAGQIIISKALAQFNGIAVGDTITVANATDSTKTYKLTVAGIYTNTSAAGGTSGGMGNAADPDNAIYTSMATLDSLSLSSASTGESPEMQLNFTYVVSDKAGYAAFAKDVKAAGLSSDYTVSSPDVEEYEASLVPLDNLAKFALTLLLIVLGVGGAVLVALNVFNIRERKYEVGVLTAIGVRKAKVAAQFVFELLIVTMAGLALGAAAGAAASVPVSNHLLASQVAAQQSQQATQLAQFGRGMQGGGMPSGSQGQTGSQPGGASNAQGPSTTGRYERRASAFGKATDYVSSINSTVNVSVVGELVLIGLALTVISSLAAVVVIMRYEPLQILADRS